jgi:hypothetical protein
MARLVKFTATTPLKIDPNLAPGDTPPAPNVIPWPRDEQGKLKVLSICTCGVSRKFPLCDGMHKTCKTEQDGTVYQYHPVSGEVLKSEPDTIPPLV